MLKSNQQTAVLKLTSLATKASLTVIDSNGRLSQGGALKHHLLNNFYIFNLCLLY